MTKRAPWRKLSELQRTYVQPPLRRTWLVAVGIVRPSATTLRKVVLPEGTPVLRVEETQIEEETKK